MTKIKWLTAHAVTHAVIQAQAVLKGSLGKENKGYSFEKNTNPRYKKGLRRSEFLPFSASGLLTDLGSKSL